MQGKLVSLILLFLLLASTLVLAFNVGLVHAQATVYINSDGSITPSSAPISTVDKVTYTFTGNISYPIYDGIIVERNNTVINGNGYTVQGNNSTNGLSLTSISNVTMKNINIEDSYYGIYLSSSNNITISGNNVTANTEGGMFLEDSSNNNVSRNTATANSYAGIYLYSSSNDNTVSGNNATTNSYAGILMSSSNNNTVSGNNATTNNGGGIFVWNSLSNIVSGNAATANGQGFGIDLEYSSNSIVSGNAATANGLGIDLEYSSNNNTVSGNNASANSEYGIDFYSSSDNNTVSGNFVSANSLENIVLASSSNNIIYHNNFISNTYREADCSNSTNTWDNGYPSGGNYWSDYNGLDLYSGPYQNVTGSDGIGDTPYSIDANNTDYYPLMLLYGSPTQLVYINSNGSVSPSSAPISTVDNVTYTLTGNISCPTYTGIVIERSNIVINGEGHTVQGADQSEDGLNLTDVSNVTIENIDIENFLVGICLFGSNNNIISGNNASANSPVPPFLSQFGILLSSSSNNTISWNNVTNNQYGVYLLSSSGNTVSGNMAAANNAAGIVVDSSSNNTVSWNNVSEEGSDGIDLLGSSNNTVSWNTANYNMLGIGLSDSNNNIVSSNSANFGYTGIFLESSLNNTLRGNTANGNLGGIQVGQSSNDNIVSGNTVTENGQFGIVFYTSSNNMIFHNNFVGNGVQASADSSSVGNVWDNGYPSGGNYWSDYNGTDLYRGQYQNVTGSDGIGDTPYVIDASNTDHYPLMQPWSPPPSSTLVTCSPASVAVGSFVHCTATVSGYNATGIITWTTSSSTGSFSSYVETLSSGTCSTTYVDNNTGYVTITASYSGDANCGPSGGNATLTVFINVTTGTNVTVTPTNNLKLTFANVTAPGIVVANATSTVPAPSPDPVQEYYVINVTASYSGNVTVSLAFDGSNMTQQQKSNLTMIQYTPIPGDVVAPFGQVDIRDVHYIAIYYGTTTSSPNWNPNADLNNDGKVDIRDVHMAAVNYGKTANWINITTYVDTTNNIIYGSTTHFSFIGIHG